MTTTTTIEDLILLSSRGLSFQSLRFVLNVLVEGEEKFHYHF